VDLSYNVDLNKIFGKSKGSPNDRFSVFDKVL